MIAQSTQYAQPQIAAQSVEVEGELITTSMLAGINVEEISEAKDWVVSVDELNENALNFSAGHYKPLTLASIQYDPPAQIIRGLQELETKIQSGLNSLLEMMESDQ